MQQDWPVNPKQRWALLGTQAGQNPTMRCCVQAQNEVAVLALLDHPNIVKYYECFAEQGTKVKIVMELCEVRLGTFPAHTFHPFAHHLPFTVHVP